MMIQFPGQNDRKRSNIYGQEDKSQSRPTSIRGDKIEGCSIYISKINMMSSDFCHLADKGVESYNCGVQLDRINHTIVALLAHHQALLTWMPVQIDPARLVDHTGRHSRRGEAEEGWQLSQAGRSET